MSVYSQSKVAFNIIISICMCPYLLLLAFLKKINKKIVKCAPLRSKYYILADNAFYTFFLKFYTHYEVSE